MKVDAQENKKEVQPIILTAILVVAALAILLIVRQFPNTNLWISIVLYLLIDIGFLIAMFLGVRTKKMPIILFSMFANSVFFLVLSGFIFLLMLANGISEP